VDLDAVRTFVAVAEAGQFQVAASELAISQQAVSKRVAGLEKDLAVRLFTRTARGAELTVDGQVFLPRARDLLEAAEHAAASVRPGHRPLRVDVVSRRLGPADLLRGFHRAEPATELAVVTLYDATAAFEAVRSGAIDATIRAVIGPRPAGLEAVRVLDEPLELLVGPAHELARAPEVTPARLANCRIWMPDMTAGTEWTAYYQELARTFGLTIDTVGPNFGTEPLLDAIAESATAATFIGDRTRFVWPADYGLRRIPLRNPAPAYPHSLVWHHANPHPALTALRTYLGQAENANAWTPAWAA
jgi:DNA-binding transcriptional LysR family regulator